MKTATAPEPDDFERYHRAKRLFLEARDLPEDEREVFLRDLSVREPEMAAFVRELLRHDRGDGRLPAWMQPSTPTNLARWWAARHVLGSSGLRSPDPAAAQIGPYRIIREIGHGGEGIVYLAEDSRPDRERIVALKVVYLLGLTASADAIDRVRREAEAASRLEHPAICPVHEVNLDGPMPYIAMRFIDGESLAQRIARAQAGKDSPAPTGSAPRTGAMPTHAEILEVVRMMEQVARALQAAHEGDVIHGDVKPGNIMIMPSGAPMLLDFGLSHLRPLDDPDVTPTGAVVVGTPAYMSPELLLGRGPWVDRRTDIWSLGVTLYECTTLRSPFRADSTAETLDAIRTRHQVDPRRLNRAVPAALSAVIGRALEKDPERRFQTALEFADELARIASAKPTPLAPAGIFRRLCRWVRRHRVLAAAVGGLIAVATSGLAPATLAVACGAMAIGVQGCGGGEGAPADVAAQIVLGLGSADPVERERAGAELERGAKLLGMPFIDALREAASAAPVDQRISRELATRIRAGAIMDANAGLPRDELVRRWNAVASLDSKFAEKARVMAGHYEQMLVEDREFEDVMPADPVAQGAYWIHKLRDLAARQVSQPGCVDIFRNWEAISQPNPAEELRKLGWAALPAIIEHLDDARPTRCVGYWRDFAPESYYLLRVADCCEQVFTAITGVAIYRRESTSGSPTNDGKTASIKTIAQDWWHEEGSAGEESSLLNRLGSTTSWDTAFAARRLLERDRARYFPRIIELLSDTKAPGRLGILQAAAPYAGPEHAKLVAGFLEGADLGGTLLVASILHDRCGSDAGLPALLAQVTKAEIPESEQLAFEGGLSFLARLPRDDVAEALTSLFSSANRVRRHEAMNRCGAMPHPRIAAALAAQLDDTAATGSSSTYAIRWCDVAGSQLVRCAGYGKPYPEDPDPVMRDAFLAELKTWWAEHGDSIDWASLRERRPE